VVPDDTPRWMRKHMPVIEVQPGARQHMELRLSVSV
jgi:hypothetical protein